MIFNNNFLKVCSFLNKVYLVFSERIVNIKNIRSLKAVFGNVFVNLPDVKL